MHGHVKIRQRARPLAQRPGRHQRVTDALLFRLDFEWGMWDTWTTRVAVKKGVNMHNEFTAVVERDGKWFIAYCPEIPGANGQGKTKAECLKSLSDAIDLILEDRREDALRGLPANAVRELVAVG